MFIFHIFTFFFAYVQVYFSHFKFSQNTILASSFSHNPFVNSLARYSFLIGCRDHSWMYRSMRGSMDTRCGTRHLAWLQCCTVLQVYGQHVFQFFGNVWTFLALSVNAKRFLRHICHTLAS